MHMFQMLLLNEKSHTLLTFVGNYFFGRKGGVANGKARHVDESATIFHQFAETVDVAGRAVVVDADDGIYLFFAKSSDDVVGSFLHLGVGTLYGIQFDTAAVASRING